MLALPFAAEACWVTNKFDQLQELLDRYADKITGDFNVGIGTALVALREGNGRRFSDILGSLRGATAQSLRRSNTMSLQACHDAMLKLHVLIEVELISGMPSRSEMEKSSLIASLNQRLNVIGAFVSDKQYLLGIRRAVMQLTRQVHNTMIIDLD